MGGTRGSGVLASAGDVLEISVVRCVGGVCDMCMCLARGGVGGVRVSRPQDWVWALPILEEHVESGVCVLVAVVWVVLGESGWAAWARVEYSGYVWEGGVVLCLCVVSLDSLC